jgi:hypothetical protein
MAKTAAHEPLANESGGKTSYERWAGARIPSSGPSSSRTSNGRAGALGAEGGRAFLQMEGAGQINNCYVCGSAGLKTAAAALRNVYVVSGSGAATVARRRQEQTFEWQTGSMFSPLLNTRHQLFNGSGSEPARYLAVTTADVINPLQSHFIFHNDFAQDRRRATNTFSGKGTYRRRIRGLQVRRQRAGNQLRPDARLEAAGYNVRGAGGETSSSIVERTPPRAHLRVFRRYLQKATATVQPTSSSSAAKVSIIWPDGQPIKKYDWHEGSMVVPPDRWWHQHFNTGREPARYLALRAFGSKKYRGVAPKYKGTVDRRQGGDQIEYEDEDPMVRRIFEEALAQNGLESRMGEHYNKKST